jgi:hypothetical protein
MVGRRPSGVGGVALAGVLGMRGNRVGFDAGHGNHLLMKWAVIGMRACTDVCLRFEY